MKLFFLCSLPSGISLPKTSYSSLWHVPSDYIKTNVDTSKFITVYFVLSEVKIMHLYMLKNVLLKVQILAKENQNNLEGIKHHQMAKTEQYCI